MKVVVRFGWLEGCSVRTFVDAQVGAFLSVPAVLVTSIDSCRETAHLIGAELAREVPSLGSSAVVDGATFLEWTMLPGSLTGFDEIALFETAPLTALPMPGALVAPTHFGEASPSSAWLAWMSESNCVLALGDGFGLNWIAR